MRRGGRILVVLGLLLGVITAGGTFLVLGNQPTSGPATRSVVVAVQPIPDKTEILAEALGKQEWPEPIPSGAFERLEDVAGKIALQPIFPGQIILPPMIVDKSRLKETRSIASWLIPDGKVAVPFPVSPQSGVAGALQAGDTVDLLLTLTPTQPTTPTTTSRATVTTITGLEGLPVTQMMLQDVPILQVGTWPTVAGGEKATPQATVVTFAVDRQDALAVKSALEQGSIWLALRKAGDHKAYTTEPVTLQYLNKRFNFNLVPAINR